MNFCSLIVQFLVITILLQGRYSSALLAGPSVMTPLYLNQILFVMFWLLFMGCQLIFVLRGMPCFKSTVHYKNVVIMKIRYGFSVVTLTFTLLCLAFVIGNNKNYQKKAWLPITKFLLFFLLKCSSQFLFYLRVKYRDDGRDLVSGYDFIALHVPASIINAWATYNVYYWFTLQYKNLCPYSSDVTEPLYPDNAFLQIICHTQYLTT